MMWRNSFLRSFGGWGVLRRWTFLLVLAETASAAADPLSAHQIASLPVRVRIEIPASTAAVRLGVGVGGVGALIEPTGSGFGVIVRSALRPGVHPPTPPTPIDRIERLLGRSPFGIGDLGSAEPGVQIELFSPGDIGVTVKYRW